MLRSRNVILGLLAAVAVALATTVAVAAPAGSPQIVKVSTLPSIGLADSQNDLFPNSPAVTAIPPGGPNTLPDRGVDLGGIGIGIFPGNSSNDFWVITDRGPNGRVNPPGPPPRVRTFPDPWFDPTILHVRASSHEIEILEAIPIVGGTSCDVPVTGLPNLSGYDEAPFAYEGLTPLAFNPNGLDTEGIVRRPGGDFWVVDEYSPSLVHLDAHGCVVERFVPAGLRLTGTDHTVTENIPGIYTKRRQNRGFEGIAVSPNGHYLFLALQSPLLNPDSATGQASRNTRILRFNLATEQFDAEYVYRFDEVCGFSGQAAGCGISPDEMKLSGLAAVSNTKLLVDERTDPRAKVYLVDLAAATNIRGPIGDNMTAPTLESLDETGLANAFIVTLPKTLVADLSTVAGIPGKIEGIAIVNRSQIVVINDNDFNILEGELGIAFDADGNMIAPNPPIPSQILRIKLPQHLPKS